MFGFGPYGILLGAAVGAAIGLGYVINNWLKRGRKKREEALRKQLDDLPEIGATPEELASGAQVEPIQQATADARRETLSYLLSGEHILEPEDRRKYQEELNNLTEGLKLQQLDIEGGEFFPELLEEFVKRAVEGDKEAIVQLEKFAKTREELFGDSDLLRNLFIEDNLVYDKFQVLLDERQEKIKLLEATSAGSIAEYNESMENMKRDMERRAKERVVQVPVPIIQTLDMLGSGTTDTGEAMDTRDLSPGGMSEQDIENRIGDLNELLDNQLSRPANRRQQGFIDNIYRELEALSSLQASRTLEVAKPGTLARLNETRENTLAMEEQQRRNEIDSQAQSPVIINQNIQNQSGGGTSSPVGPLNTRPTTSRLDDMILGIP
jgi:hypothetical protein